MWRETVNPYSLIDHHKNKLYLPYFDLYHLNFGHSTGLNKYGALLMARNNNTLTYEVTSAHHRRYHPNFENRELENTISTQGTRMSIIVIILLPFRLSMARVSVS